MRSVGVRELKERASELLRLVRESGEEVEVTYHGRAVARLVPVSPTSASREEATAVWSDLDQLAEEIGRRWQPNVTAVDAVREGRRDL